MASDQPPPPEYNPFSPASIDDINKRREEALRRKAILEEEIAEFKVVINRLASSPDGQYFLRKLIRFAGIFHEDNEINPAKMVEQKGKRKAYLDLVRPYLTFETRQALESET